MKKIFIFLMLSLLPLALFGKIEVRYLSVEGVGSTRAEAIRDGLIEAIKQTNGVNIESKKRYYKQIKQVGITLDGDSSSGFSVSERTQKFIREATNGFVRNYSITNADNIDGEWHVRLKIKFKNYKTPGLDPNKRRKIAIMPFESKLSYVILNDNELGNKVSKILTQTLVSKITQARKFAVLDRENSKYYQGEKNFILSGDSGRQELLKLGKRLGTDYLLVGQILDFSIENITEQNNIGLPETSSIICSATISYRILAMATQQVKWSETLSESIEINYDSNEAMLVNVSQKISSVILRNILANIYPPKIIAITSRNIIINQGGNSVKKGEVFKAYKAGERLTDPYTNEFLGYEEIETGEIVITKVNPKVSYAKTLNGIVSKDMILRKVKIYQNHQAEGEAITDVKINKDGGIVLPF